MTRRNMALLMILAFTLAMIFYSAGILSGYRYGQIDALNNKVYYCLDKQELGELEWVYHSEGCK